MRMSTLKVASNVYGSCMPLNAFFFYLVNQNKFHQSHIKFVRVRFMKSMKK